MINSLLEEVMMTRKKFRRENVPLKLLTAVNLVVLLLVAAGLAAGQKLKLDERAAAPGEWGYRPTEGAVSAVNPPSFSWRPQKELTWEVECARDSTFKRPVYLAENLAFNVH